MLKWIVGASLEKKTNAEVEKMAKVVRIREKVHAKN